MPSPVSRSDQWDAICFPVRTEPLQNLLPAGYYVDASDRQKVVIAERMGEHGIDNRVVAIQSAGYSLVPNQLIWEVVEAQVPQYDLQILSTPSYDFATLSLQ